MLLDKRMFIALFFWMQIDSLAEDGDEVRKEPPVHVPGHLVEDKPVPDAAVEDVVLDVPEVGIRFEVPVHLGFHQKVSSSEIKIILPKTKHYFKDRPQFCREELTDAIEEPEDTVAKEDEVPPPENQEDFVIDHIETEHTYGIQPFLMPTGSKPLASVYNIFINKKVLTLRI